MSKAQTIRLTEDCNVVVSLEDGVKIGMSLEEFEQLDSLDDLIGKFVVYDEEQEKLEKKCNKLLEEINKYIFVQLIKKPTRSQLELCDRELYIFKTIQNDDSLDLTKKHSYYKSTLSTLKAIFS